MASLPPATIKVQQPKDTSKTCRLVGGSSNKMTHVYESSFTSSRKWDGLPQLFTTSSSSCSNSYQGEDVPSTY
ncbi:hypothetical protein FRX31_021391 [Thalictrum thalictroides]|uniref:Uncharacterized protein n=1 Tax=Thalictrum thalictroides TaxID=46969 RepID=A0A7J6VVZ0_THATH|nr:hypothetical protein FRX31_021391 [Thalictrum thalictroides]